MNVELKSKRVLLSVVAAMSVVILSGCSAHQDPPLTPTDSAKTPTFRSSSNSYDQPNTPLYTQPGINTGHVVTLPSIPRHDRWDQNAPLALAVYGQISGLGRTDINYVSVQSKGSAVMVGGTVPTAALKAKVLALAKATPGVKSLVSTLKVQGP
jgi:hypothetical protein